MNFEHIHYIILFTQTNIQILHAFIVTCLTLTLIGALVLIHHYSIRLFKLLLIKLSLKTYLISTLIKNLILLTKFFIIQTLIPYIHYLIHFTPILLLKDLFPNHLY